MYPTHYIEYLAHFHGTRDYFECHEVLEEYWKKVEPKNRNSVWVFLIQLAVCMYHFRRGNRKGASILISKCLNHLHMHKMTLSELQINPEKLQLQLEELKISIDHNHAYSSMNLPIEGPGLITEVEHICMLWGVVYGKPSDLDDSFLIHKHKLRNRS